MDRHLGEHSKMLDHRRPWALMDLASIKRVFAVYQSLMSSAFSTTALEFW